MSSRSPLTGAVIAAASLVLSSCANTPTATRPIDHIQTVVVIYAENRAFDTLYGLFPGANGIPGVNPTSSERSAPPQRDVDGRVLATLPPIWGGVTARGQNVMVSQQQTAGLPNRPFAIDAPNLFEGSVAAVDANVITRDLVHRYYNNRMQIGDGSNDYFAAYSDAGALAMSYYDGSRMALWKIARQYTLADNFFMGAFGGSFLNHQYLICACVPVYPNADTSIAQTLISAIDVDANGKFLRLTPAAHAASSVLESPPKYLRDSTLTPRQADGRFYAVNTMQPAYQPSGNAAAQDARYADTGKPTTLPAQTAPTIGDLLSAKGISWAWYAGAWNAAQRDRANIYSTGKAPNFQAHHQPFNYYASFDPATQVAERAAHLRDFDSQFWADAQAGRLPAVTFYKPQGNLNQHAGYASVADGDAHIAKVIERLQASPQWPHMLIVVTYDENGGYWDHARVPRGDVWGPGTRIPTVIVSPFAKRGFVDKTPYDTGSILRFITRRWQLPMLAGLAQRDRALAENGEPPMGDLAGALSLPSGTFHSP